MPVQAIEEKISAARSDRITFTYNIPKSLWRDGVAHQVSLHELTSDEEIRASKLGRVDGRMDVMKAQCEAVKASICMLDGKSVNNADGTIDIFWNKIGAKARSLLLQAYNKATSPSDEEEKDFFASEAVTA